MLLSAVTTKIVNIGASTKANVDTAAVIVIRKCIKPTFTKG